MSCIFLILFVIVSCGAQELETEPEHLYNITAVRLPKLEAATSGTRIIGGSATTIEKFPYIVQVLSTNSLICAGSLITTRHVLSAAHCFVNDAGVLASPRLYSIRAGSTNLYSGGTIYTVSALVVHENYNMPIRDNDVAVMVLASDVTLSNSVQTVTLPLADENLADNSTVVVIGWGTTHANIPAVSTVLNEVTVKTVNQETCVARYELLQTLTGQLFPITSSMLCAGILDVGGADACQGDSGGPLLYEDIVVGITSWGVGCAEPMFPGVYTRVSSYTNWINETVRPRVVRYSDAPSSHLVGGISLLVPLLFTLLNF